MLFSTVVKRALAKERPEHGHIQTIGGSGPILTFAWPVPATAPRLRSMVCFQKGQWGAEWFGVTFQNAFEAQARGGGCVEQPLFPAAALALEPDVRYGSPLEIEEWLHVNLHRIDAHASLRLAALTDAYPQLLALYGEIIEHYAVWFDAQGKNFPPTEFLVPDESEPGLRRVPAFDSFAAWLVRRGLVTAMDRGGVLIGSVNVGLWEFWTQGRPQAKGEFIKGEYDTCDTCGKWAAVSRGEAVARSDPFVGCYYVFRCGKCKRKAE